MEVQKVTILGEKMDTKQKIFLDANKIDTVIYTVSQKTRH